MCQPAELTLNVCRHSNVSQVPFARNKQTELRQAGGHADPPLHFISMARFKTVANSSAQCWKVPYGVPLLAGPTVAINVATMTTKEPKFTTFNNASQVVFLNSDGIYQRRFNRG